jgi:mannose-6-phosphate isomerase
MYPFKLKPAVKSYLWGGNRLSSEFGIGTGDTPVAEAWMLSCHPAGTSVILNGSLAGKALSDILPGNFEKILGTSSPADAGFPILIKFIDANKDLSIQVHPGNEYHGVDSGESGKTEMWYILDALEGAYIYYGFSREVTKEEMLKHIEEKTITSILNRVYVKKGDSFYIKSGTVHSMGPGFSSPRFSRVPILHTGSMIMTVPMPREHAGTSYRQSAGCCGQDVVPDRPQDRRSVYEGTVSQGSYPASTLP